MTGFTDVESSTQTYKLLMVGNSFASNAATWLGDICQSAEIDLIVGVIDIGGCRLEQHWSRIQNNENAPFYKWDQTGETHLIIPYHDVFSHEHWDIITFQQFSGMSGIYETFQPYLTHLRDYARACATNPKVKFGWHSTWAYATDSQHSAFINYNNDQMSMYHAITNATKQAMDKMDFDIVIPSGTAIQNARTHNNLNKIGYELTRDGHHLDDGMGRFIAALTVFETLISHTYKKNLFSDVSFNPLDNHGTKHLCQLAKAAAKHAVLYPFQVTVI